MKDKVITLEWVRKFAVRMSGGAVHKYQEQSLSLAVFGALHSPRLSSADIGRSLAKRADRCPKHAIKQVDRLLGNTGIDRCELLVQMCHLAIGARREIVASLDWTDYESSDQSMITINLITQHGRATPLVWECAVKSKLKHHRTQYEKKVLRLLSRSIPAGTKVTVLADRGFAGVGLFAYIQKKLGWDYTIRIKNNIELYDEKYPRGRKVQDVRLVRGATARELPHVLLTKKKYRLGSFVAVWDREMKKPWYLATSLVGKAPEAVKRYGRRFTCEEYYRDEKDYRFGEGSKLTSVSTTERRSMLTLIHAIAAIILTIVGAAGKAVGYDRRLRVNTKKHRTYSLYRQGKEYVDGVQSEFIRSFRRTIRVILIAHAQLTEMYGVI